MLEISYFHLRLIADVVSPMRFEEMIKYFFGRRQDALRLMRSLFRLIYRHDSKVAEPDLLIKHFMHHMTALSWVLFKLHIWLTFGRKLTADTGAL